MASLARFLAVARVSLLDERSERVGRFVVKVVERRVERLALMPDQLSDWSISSWLATRSCAKADCDAALEVLMRLSAWLASTAPLSLRPAGLASGETDLNPR